MNRPAVIVTRADLADSGFRVFARKSQGPDSEIWIIVVDGERATERHVALMLAALELDSHRQLVRPMLLPPGPSWFFVYFDEDLRHGYGRTFPPWATREVTRLTEVLLSEHSEYTSRIVAAIRTKVRDVLEPIPSGFIISDPMGMGGWAGPPPTLAPDFSRAPVHTLDQQAQEDYRRDRYMAHLDDRQLSERARDIIGNLHRVKDDGTRVIDLHAKEAPHWLALFAEVVSEMQSRHGPYPAGWDKDAFSRELWPPSMTASTVSPGSLAVSRPMRDSTLVKYGRRRFMDPFLERGELRVASAASYDDPSFDPARHDDELGRDLDVGPFALGRIHGLPPWVTSRSALRLRVRREVGTNYYVSCFSTVLERRLLHDFEADCCVVIIDSEAFERRIESAMATELPNWEFAAGPVSYYDPIQASDVAVQPLTWKHFRYAYQREYRMAWVPTSPTRNLRPINVAVGPLTDIAELVELPV